MDNRKLQFIIILLIPYAIIAGMFLKAAYPVFTGSPILLNVSPVDPRDLMRGQYVDLRYDFSELDLKGISVELPLNRKFSFGDYLYLALDISKPNAPARIKGIYLNKPDNMIVLKITPKDEFTFTEDIKKQSEPFVVSFFSGIETYFADPEMALALEQQNRNNELLAEVYLTKNGEARITALVPRRE
ncbi:MAG: GDYXXLXY domain-containing protein [Leptospiraceae bacterium]|nr:GDYXXLXY domain-containing protein [Leptospiraceae bacterium]